MSLASMHGHTYRGGGAGPPGKGDWVIAAIATALIVGFWVLVMR